jgi:uncharacterized membrane protein
VEFTSGFLVAGLLIILAGAILIYQSIKASPSEAKSRAKCVYFIGPLPILVEGSRKWIIAAIWVASVVLVWLASSSLNIGWA